MKYLRLILLLMAVWGAVWLAVWSDGWRKLGGGAVDLLPALIVYASLARGLTSVFLVAVLGGVGMDAFSANPLGVSVLPLLGVGVLIHHRRKLLLRDLLYAQFVLGLAVSALVPVVTLLLLVTFGGHPLLSGRLLWPWLLTTLLGGAATPVLFRLFERLEESLRYPLLENSALRANREIVRGRNY